jgi:hypothetical protein
MNGKTFTPPTTSFFRRQRGWAASLVLGLGVWAAPDAQAQTWMVSTTPQIELTVANSSAQAKPYTATFVVRNEKTGKAYSLVKSVEEPKVSVLFPTEPGAPDYFKTETGEVPKTAPGKFVWECTVDGTRIGGGRFVYAEFGNDVIVRDQR